MQGALLESTGLRDEALEEDQLQDGAAPLMGQLGPAMLGLPVPRDVLANLREDAVGAGQEADASK